MLGRDNSAVVLPDRPVLERSSSERDVGDETPVCRVRAEQDALFIAPVEMNYLRERTVELKLFDNSPSARIAGVNAPIFSAHKEHFPIQS